MLQAPNVSMLLILAIFFAVLWLLNRFIFRPVGAILDERERDSTTASQTYAEALAEFQAAADKIEADLSLARREALKLREERRAEGMHLRSGKIEQVKAETAEKLSGASADLEQHSRKIVADLPVRVAALAQLLAEKILGRKVAA
jgi:F0F1-type ATP synthase membrane subunit b/b'